MNVDAFQGKGFPSIKWYFVVAVPLMLAVTASWFLLRSWVPEAGAGAGMGQVRSGNVNGNMSMSGSSGGSGDFGTDGKIGDMDGGGGGGRRRTWYSGVGRKGGG